MKRYLEPITDKVTRIEDVSFAQVKGHQGEDLDLKLDIYTPENDTETNRRVIIVIHGGGFRNCTKQQDYVVTLCNEFTQLGYVCVSMDYRLYSAETYPGRKVAAVSTAEDVEWARRFLCENADKYGIDMTNVALLGGSAGGMTVNEACKNKAAGYKCSVCLWGGPEEITDPEMYTDFFMAHGTDDHTVAYEKSEKLLDALTKVGVHAELIPIAGADHTPIHMRDVFMPRAIEFLNERMN